MNARPTGGWRGLIWSLGTGGQLYQVSRTAPTVRSGQSSIGLPVTAASARALALIGAHLSAGRLYDAGMDRRGDPVVLLGSVAAQQLGITEVGETPAIFIGRTELTVIGVVDRAPRDPQALLGLIVPPGAAASVGGQFAADYSRQIMVRTLPGAAAHRRKARRD
jgi:putative ABC transport system permease protein